MREFFVWEVRSLASGSERTECVLPYRQASIAHLFASHLPGGYVTRSRRDAEPEGLSQLCLTYGRKSYVLTSDMAPATATASRPVAARVSEQSYIEPPATAPARVVKWT